MLELSDRDLEVAIIKMLQQAIMECLKQMKNKSLNKQVENLSKEIEYIRMN